MLENSHLPVAVADCDPDTISERSECEILLMAEECGRWLKSFGSYRASLITAPAMALWTALVQVEVDQVSAMYEQLMDEIENRTGHRQG